MNTITYKQILEKELPEYKELILPMIYEELKAGENIEENYIALAAVDADMPIGALVAELEADGDISLLSIWTDQRYRRKGVASGLLQKLSEIARALYVWEDGQYGDDVSLKVMYCLEEKYRQVFEAWLEKNDFTEFMVMREEDAGRPSVCGATAQIHFYRTGL